MPRPAPSDTIPAMLTPREAVLNVEAADLLGRDNIAALNKAGLAKRYKGVVPLEGYACGTSKVQGYANGTEDVSTSTPAPQTAANLITSDSGRQAAALDFQSRTGYMPGSWVNSQPTSAGKIASPVQPAQAPASKAPSTEVGIQKPDFGSGQTTLGKTNVYKSGNSYSDKGFGGAQKPVDVNANNRANAYTGITDLGGGDNAQAKANMFAKTPPVAGMAPMATGIMKQFKTEQANLLPEIGARLGGGDKLAKPVPEQQPSDDYLLNLPGEYEVQGYADGVTEVPKLGDLPQAREIAQKLKYPEAYRPGEVRPAHGFTGDPGARFPEPNPNVKPGSFQFGAVEPEQKYQFRPTSASERVPASRSLIPVQRNKGVVPQGKPYVDVGEPATMKPQQFRPGPGGAPTGEYTVNFANDGRIAGQKALPAPKPAAATGYSPAELDAMEKVKAAGRARVEALKTGAAAPESATAAAIETPAAAGAAPSGVRGFIGRALQGLSSAGALQTQAASQILNNPLVAKGREEAIQRAREKVTGKKAGAVVPEQKIPQEKTAFQNEMEQLVSGNATDMANEAATKAPGGVKFGPQVEKVDNFTPREVGGGYRVDLDANGQYIQSKDKAAMDRVAKGLRERGGIVGAAQRQQPGEVSDFWTNRGLPGGAAQWKQEQEMNALRNVALYGGGTGDMTLSQYRNANARQKAAQDMLSDLQKVGVEREKLGVEKESNKAALATAGAKERIAQQRHEEDIEQKRLDREQAAEIAGNKPIKIGDDIVATNAVPAYQARKQHEAKVASLSDYVKKNSGVFTSSEDALTQGLIESGDKEGDELAELKAYLNVAKSPEQKKQIETEIANRLKPYRSALNG